jgi:hypothetical protein
MLRNKQHMEADMPEIEAEATSTVTIEFEVFCAKCGAGLCGNTTVGTTKRRGMPFVEITPCERCLKDEYDRGREEAEEAI